MSDASSTRVLILGGAGFIGQHLCRSLLATGTTVRCFDAKIPGAGSIAIGSGRDAEWIQGDYSDAEQLARALEGVDYVYHLISTTLPESSNKDLQFDLSSNVLSTVRLLEAIRKSNVKKIIFVSSGGTVYGIPNTIPIPETHETNPICGYGIHKLAIEKYLHLFHHLHDLDYCVLRLSNPYGVAQISDRPQGVIGKFVYKAIRGEPLEIWGDGNVIRDYIYIDEVVEALLLAMSYQGSEKVFNVASGSGHSLLDIIRTIEKKSGIKLDIRFLPPRPVDVPVNVLDISRVKSEFSWVPKIDMQSGIEKMLAYGANIKGLL